MWRRIWLAAQREFIANVKTKTFLIAVLSFPVILALAGTFPLLLERQAVKAKPFTVLSDGAHGLAAELRVRYDADEAIRKKFTWVDAPVATPGEADRAVAAGTLFAYIEIPADMIERGRATYATRNLANRDLWRWTANQLRQSVRERRFDAAGVSTGQRDRIMEPIDLASRTVDEAGTGRKATDIDTIKAYAPLLFVYLLWVAIITVAQMLLTNVIEEKSNRVVEVLLSALTSAELMAGKITGLAATGLTMVSAWFLSALAFVRWGLPVMLPTMGDDGGDKIFALAWSLFTARNLTFFSIYFMLGFLLFAAIFAAIGAICSSVKDSQNLQTPVIMVMIVPLLSMTFITQNPHATYGVILSYIPPFTPFVMMNRVAATPSAPGAEIAATIVLLAVSVVVAYAVAGRVFRVGILMTGKPPTPRELWRIMWTR